MKVAVIGGGSYLWSFGFARQFVASERLDDVTISLMDISKDALDLVAAAAGVCNDRAGSPIAIESTTDRAEALEGADFVIVSISTGGLDAMDVDTTVPEKYGIWHTVGDTVGPGGWSRAVRNIPVFRDIAADMKELCPDAWMVNVSNPLSVLTRVPGREFGIKSIGLCPGVEDQAATYLRIAGIDESARVDYTVTGIDHGSWFTRLYADGEDVLERLRAMGFCRDDGVLPAAVKTDDPLATDATSRAIFAEWAEIGYLPSISDRHAVENWPWYLPRDKEGQIPMDLTRTTTAQRREGLELRRKRLTEYAASDGAEESGAGHGDDPVVAIIEALSGLREFTYSTNYTNIGQTPELLPGAVVETRARYDAGGVHPFASPMPPVLQAMVAPHVIRQEAVIDIALSGGFSELVALVRTDPMCSRLEAGQCRKMMREMLDANSQLIQNPRLLEFDS